MGRAGTYNVGYLFAVLELNNAVASYYNNLMCTYIHEFVKILISMHSYTCICMGIYK